LETAGAKCTCARGPQQVAQTARTPGAEKARNGETCEGEAGSQVERGALGGTKIGRTNGEHAGKEAPKVIAASHATTPISSGRVDKFKRRGT
ncbi:MAG: hypothetical protein WCD40_03170, partial [Candidatus Acidiferrales bacterium]